MSYLVSLLRDVKGDKILIINRNTNKPKQVLVTDIAVPSLPVTLLYKRKHILDLKDIWKDTQTDI